VVAIDEAMQTQYQQAVGQQGDRSGVSESDNDGRKSFPSDGVMNIPDRSRFVNLAQCPYFGGLLYLPANAQCVECTGNQEKRAGAVWASTAPGRNSGRSFSVSDRNG
jgi:hypothetical protein